MWIGSLASPQPYGKPGAEDAGNQTRWQKPLSPSRHGRENTESVGGFLAAETRRPASVVKRAFHPGLTSREDYRR